MKSWLEAHCKIIIGLTFLFCLFSRCGLWNLSFQPGPLQQEHRVLVPGAQGKSLIDLTLISFSF